MLIGCISLAGCHDDQSASTAGSAAGASASTAATTANASATTSDLPKACDEYLKRAKACFAKADASSAAAFQQGIDQSTAQWKTITDKDALGAACKAASDQFAQVASSLHCE
ncbi:hypothetical protein [Dyella amyloliquefaciens]|uniref:hypothetical protein n=1 Tax=Dyella amyloliquefaciens TaxID=1770545 RepID=UPI00102ECBE9|nr:hypothetical protein [Dyella amyloliquefaciens]